jgi:hypothetical protein
VKSNAVSGTEQERIGPRAIERFETGASDQMPAAWSLAGINPGLTRGDRHRTGGHAQPRAGPARQRQSLIEAGHVGKAWNKADYVDAVSATGVQRDDIRFADASTHSHVRQIRTEFAAVTYVDGHFLSWGRLSGGWECRRDLMKVDLELRSIDTQRIEIDRRGTVSNDGITDSWIESPGAIGEQDRAAVHLVVDPRRPFDEPRGITSRDDAKIAHRLVRVRLERRQKLLMNVVEAAVRHDDDEITGARLFADGANNVGNLGNVARIDARRLQIGHQRFG